MNILPDILGTAIEMIILCSLEYMDVPKKKLNISILLWSILGILVVIMTKYSMPFMQKLCFIFLATMLISKKCYQTNYKRIALCFIIYLLSISIGEVICFSFLRIVTMDKVNSFMAIPLNLLLVIVISKSFTLAFILYIQRFIKKLQKSLGKASILTITPLFTCFLVLCIESFRIYSAETFSLKECIFTGLNIIFVLISTFCIIKLIEKYLQTKEVELATSLDIEQISNSYHYLSKKVESQQQVSELYHDLKNHLLILKSKEDHPEYINGLLNKISNFETFVDTGNSILNTLIYEKSKFSKFYKIDLKILIDLNYISSIKDFDICTIFGNAIDNAIEACLKMEADDKRYIRISANKMRKFLIIKIENSKGEKTLSYNDELLSSKADKSMHGYGLKSIHRVVHKYNGEVHTYFNQSSFSLKIAIPLSNTA